MRKQKTQKNYVIEIIYLEKNKTNKNSFKKDHKELIKNNKLIRKTQKKDLKVKDIMFLLKKLIRLL